jgi:hypothetical protein
MPRYKILKGVAHNIGHSFTSLMNYAKDDHTMGHILRFARETGQDTLVIDFLSGEGRPLELLRDPISQIPYWYTKKFWDMVASGGSDRALVQSATLTLKYDLSRAWPLPITGSPANFYTCEVSILDNRNKIYSAHFSGSWYVERVGYIPSFRIGWNPLTWFRGTRNKLRS